MIIMRPNAPDGYVLRGMAYHEMHRYDQAIADFTRALQLTSLTEGRAVLYYNRGLSFYDKKDFTPAIADYEKAIQLSPKMKDVHRNLAIAYFGRASLYYGKHEIKRAIADVHHAIEEEPYEAEMWGNLGWYEYLDGNITRAIECDQKALTFNDQVTYIHLNLGLCYAVQGKGEKAKAQYEAARAKPGSKEMQGGIQDIQDALKKQPNSAALKQSLELLQNGLRH